MYITKCRSCGDTNNFVEILDLGQQAWGNNNLTKEQIGTEKVYPLKLIYCTNCNMLQLNYTVSKETMFSSHDYISGTTKTLTNHFYNLAKENIDQFEVKDTDWVLDIGGNDGTQLKQYKKLGINFPVNVESATNIAKISREENNIFTYNAFFNEQFAWKKFTPGQFKIINASGVFFHLEELHSVIRAIKYLLHPDGAFVVTFMYAGEMTYKNDYLMIYHEHLLYYTLYSLEKLLEPYDLKVFDAYYSNIHNGSIVAKIRHSCLLDPPDSRDNGDYTDRYLRLKESDKELTLKRFINFGNKVCENRFKLKNMLADLKSKGNKLYGFGCPVKGNTLLQYEQIDNTILDKIVEVNELKIGKYTPVTHIPIVKESKEDIPDYYLLLSYNFSSEILAKNPGVKFIHPITCEIIGG